MNHWVETAIQLLTKSLHPIPQELNEIDWKSGLLDKSDRLAHIFPIWRKYAASVRCGCVLVRSISLNRYILHHYNNNHSFLSFHNNLLHCKRHKAELVLLMEFVFGTHFLFSLLSGTSTLRSFLPCILASNRRLCRYP